MNNLIRKLHLQSNARSGTEIGELLHLAAIALEDAERSRNLMQLQMQEDIDHLRKLLRRSDEYEKVCRMIAAGGNRTRRKRLAVSVVQFMDSLQ